jgi:hypothetical protein
MTYTEPRTKEILSYADRSIIAGVLNWDDPSRTYAPEDIKWIAIEEGMVLVGLVSPAGKKQRHIVDRFVFRSILEAQRSSINKRLDEIIEIESAEVLEAEREMSEIIHAAAQQEVEESLGLAKYDWLTEPIGASLDYIFGMSGEGMAEALPPVETGYHEPNWTDEGCEF